MKFSFKKDNPFHTSGYAFTCMHIFPVHHKKLINYSINHFAGKYDYAYINPKTAIVIKTFFGIPYLIVQQLH